jgi:predicted nucleic acid-binding protein
VIAPPLLYAEATSVLRRSVFQSNLLEVEAETALHDLLSLPIRIVGENAVYMRAFSLSSHFGQARAYDTQFLALAETEGATLFTADSVMHKHSLSIGVPARLLP